jgi:putative oxidoreductase
VTACAEAWVAFSSPAHAGIPAALAVLGVTLALIGPGEWSVDARLYGRKHFIPPRL